MNNEKQKDILIEVKNLKKWFPMQHGLQTLFAKQINYVKAVDGVSFSIRNGEIFGLIGESGCGKTTTGKILMKLQEPTSGTIIFNGENVTNVPKKQILEYRRKVQMIFQDPYSSMNPRFKIRDVVSEPLVIHKSVYSRSEKEVRVAEALKSVKVTPPSDFMNRYPHMLSGGQRQRVATARSIILSPQILVADEPVSMIDLSTRAEILQMMRTLQKEFGLTFLYITHDLSTARYFTDRIAVMYLGRIVELGKPDQIIDKPQHPYTKALIDAVCEPLPGKVKVMKKLQITGEIPSAARIPKGCRFHTRCLFVKDECINLEEPELMDIGDDHMHACRRYKEIN